MSITLIKQTINTAKLIFMYKSHGSLHTKVKPNTDKPAGNHLRQQK